MGHVLLPGRVTCWAGAGTDLVALVPQMQEDLPVYCNSIRDFHTKLDHLHVQLAKRMEILAEDKR